MISAQMAVVLVLGYATCVFSASELRVLHNADSVYLPTHSSLRTTDIEPVIRQLMGFTTQRPTSWTGQADTLHRAEATLLLAIRGLDKPGLQAMGAVMSTYTYDVEGPQLENVDRALHRLTADIETGYKDGTVIKATKEHIKTFGAEGADWNMPVKVNSEKATLKEEMANMQRLKHFLSTSKVSNGAPDVYAMDIHGAEGVTEQNEMQELMENIHSLLSAFRKAYGENCLSLLLVESDQPITDEHLNVRRKRQADEGEDEDEGAQVQSSTTDSVTVDYEFVGSNRPAILAIILFTSIALILLVFFVLVMFWFTDPGKDTIIYRMTSTKKMD